MGFLFVSIDLPANAENSMVHLIADPFLLYVDYSDIAVSRNWYTRHLFMILGGPDANGWVRLLAYQEAGDDPELTLQLVGKLLGWYQALPIKNIDESGNAILDG